MRGHELRTWRRTRTLKNGAPMTAGYMAEQADVNICTIFRWQALGHRRLAGSKLPALLKFIQRHDARGYPQRTEEAGA